MTKWKLWRCSVSRETAPELARGRTDRDCTQRYYSFSSSVYDRPTRESCIFCPSCRVNYVSSTVRSEELVWSTRGELIGEGEGESEGIEGEEIEEYRVECAGENVV